MTFFELNFKVDRPENPKNDMTPSIYNTSRD